MIKTPTTPETDPPHDDEAVQNDAVIGVAARRSALALVVIALAAVAGVWWFNRQPPAPPPEPVDPGAQAQTQTRTVEPPHVPFTDVAEAAGVAFTPTSGAQGDKLLPETMIGGVAFIDYDADGDQDLLFTNAAYWPGDPRRATEPAPTPRLFANDGAGRFTDVTADAGLDRISIYGMGVAAADYDADADIDLYLTALGPNVLLRNDDAVFTDVTRQAGAAGPPDAWSTSAGFADLDADGDLDLFVGNYVNWSREIDFDVDYRLDGVGRAYGPPTDYAGQHPTLLRNDGAAFTDVSPDAGVHIANPATDAPVAKALGVRFIDIDHDRLPEIIVANDTTRNFLFKNRGGMRFDEIGLRAGLAYDGMGKPTGAMGVDAAALRTPDAWAVSIGNFANEETSLYIQDADSAADWLFLDAARVEGLGAPTRRALTFGLFFFDYDLDGRPDLFHANGHVEDEINTFQPSQQHAQPPQLFWNAAAAGASGPTLVEVRPPAAADLHQPVVGRGAAYADIDADGDLDVAIAQAGGPPRLLRNDQNLGRDALRLELIGRPPNTSAIGAVVEAVVNARTIRAEVAPTRSYLSQVELPVTIGLGDAERPDAVRVIWPDGAEQVLDPARLRINQTNVVRQEDAS